MGLRMPDMDVALKDAMEVEGAVGVALVDYASGMALGYAGGGRDFDLTVAAAGITDVVRAKLRTMEMLAIEEQIEDILITTEGLYHLVRPLTTRSGAGLYLYLILDKSRANLALARFRLRRIEANVDV
jgi:hypothetical protein